MLSEEGDKLEVFILSGEETNAHEGHSGSTHRQLIVSMLAPTL